MNTKVILAVLAAALVATCSYCCYSLTARVDRIEAATVQTVGWINGVIEQTQAATDTNNTTQENN